MPARRSNTCVRDRLAREALASRAARRARPRRAPSATARTGTVSSSTRFSARGHAGLAEILLREDVGRDLAPGRRNVDVLEPEDDRAVRIPDLAGRPAELDLRIGLLPGLGVTTFNPHLLQSLFISLPRARKKPPRGATSTQIRNTHFPVPGNCRPRASSGSYLEFSAMEAGRPLGPVPQPLSPV